MQGGVKEITKVAQTFNEIGLYYKYLYISTFIILRSTD